MLDGQELLIKKAKNGDVDSFEQLINSSKTKAYNIALRHLSNEQDALDALQESYIKIFRSLNSFREESSFDTWVYRIVVNTCNDTLRKNNSTHRTVSLYKNDADDQELFIEIPDYSGSPDRLLDKKETGKMILKSLEKLTPEHREAIILRDVQGFTYEEIAAILQVSVGTVKSRINRGRLILRNIILKEQELAAF
jgi:RNA polymerase sigma factor (sigma-70 family)